MGAYAALRVCDRLVMQLNLQYHKTTAGIAHMAVWHSALRSDSVAPWPAGAVRGGSELWRRQQHSSSSHRSSLQAIAGGAGHWGHCCCEAWAHGVVQMECSWGQALVGPDALLGTPHSRLVGLRVNEHVWL